MTRPKGTKHKPKPDAGAHDPVTDILGLARLDLACFIQLLRPDLMLAPHVLKMVERFEAVEHRVAAIPALVARAADGLGLARLAHLRPSREIIQVCPQYGKTSALELFAAFFLGKHPNLSVIWVSYGAALAEDSGKRVRSYLAEPFFQACFPDCRISPDSNAADRLGLTAGGSATFVGVGGPITGRSASGLLLCDDTIKGREEADSALHRANLKAWFTQVAYTRLSANAGVIMVGTPWHGDDLLGWLPREHSDQGWRVLRMPALCDSEDDPLGREIGEPLWPSKHNAEQLEAIRSQMGSTAFVSLMQLRPSAAAGTVFCKDWFKTLQRPWPSWQRVVQSWDTSFGKQGRRSGDYSACATLAINNAGVAVLHVWRGKPDFPSLKRKVQELAREWRVSTLLIESAGSGISLEQELRAGWEGLDIPQIIPREARGAKRLRAEAVSAMCEAGKVSFADGPWLPAFIDELVSFPDGCLHDDQVDAFTQGLAYLRDGYTGAPTIITTSPSLSAHYRDYMAQTLRAINPFRANGGFHTPRPVLPSDAPELSPAAAAAAAKIVAGGSGTVEAMETMMWASIGEIEASIERLLSENCDA